MVDILAVVLPSAIRSSRSFRLEAPMGPLSWQIERRQFSTRKGEKEEKSTWEGVA